MNTAPYTSASVKYQRQLTHREATSTCVYVTVEAGRLGLCVSRSCGGLSVFTEVSYTLESSLVANTSPFSYSEIIDEERRSDLRFTRVREVKGADSEHKGTKWPGLTALVFISPCIHLPLSGALLMWRTQRPLKEI